MSFWKGQTTTNACITILSEESCPEKLEHLIEEIVVRNKCESVLLTILRLHDIELVTRDITRAELLGGYLIGMAGADSQVVKTAHEISNAPERDQDAISPSESMGSRDDFSKPIDRAGPFTNRGRMGDALAS